MIKLSDPLPPYCSACANTDLTQRYVDFDAEHDGGIHMDGERVVATSDDLHICESCMQAAVEVLDIRPEVDAARRRENERLVKELDRWRTYARSLECTLEERPEPAPRSARRKVAA